MKHMYLLAHRLESQEGNRTHIWLNKWLAHWHGQGSVSCHHSPLPSETPSSVSRRLSLG